MKRCIILLLAIVLPAAVTSDAAAQADFEFEAPLHIAIDSLSLSPFPMYAYLTNTGDSTDVFQIELEFDLPDTSWMALLCVQGFCLPPGFTTAVETLAVSEYDSVMDVSIISKGFGMPEVHGACYASLTVTSMRNPSLVKRLDFTFISDGTGILVMDDDGDQDYETYYEDALPEEYVQGTWTRALQPPTADELGTFDAILWFTGEATPTLTEEDRQALEAYLDTGGRLMMSGQDIGFALADPSSDEYSQSTLEFFNSYLHAEYVSDDAGIYTLTGVSGDPISDDLDLEIQGGDGADNQTSPDIIDPVSPAVGIYEYGPGDVGALRAESGGHKVAYFAFGFEAVNSQATRDELMRRTVQWLLSPTGISGDEPGDSRLPKQIALSQNYPNPFNPQTRIVVEIPGDEGQQVSVNLAVYSIRGRVVATLADGTMDPGTHAFTWDGKDQSGNSVPSGPYFYRLTSGDRVVTKKMLLVK